MSGARLSTGVTAGPSASHGSWEPGDARVEPHMTTLWIDGTEALPYKPRQLSDVPPETAAMPLGESLLCASLVGPGPGIILALLREESREADLSTEQAGAQAPPWLPDSDGYSGRSQGAQCASRAWPQAAQCVTAAPTWNRERDARGSR